MKLYYSPGACSLSPHIVLRETNTPVTLVKTDIRAKKTEDGRNFLEVNPRGYVPALELDDGTVLTEGPAIVQYVADKAGATSLAPACGTMERYRLQEWLNFVSTELHKGFSPLFNPAMPDAGKVVVKERLMQRIAALDTHLEGKDYIMGKNFTLPDAYAFTVLGWTVPTKIDLTPYKNIVAYRERIMKRPAVQAAMKAEGLIK
jgi:glutathione S-transferase